MTIDLSEQSKFARIVLGLLGFSIWLAIYIPLISLAYRAISMTSIDTQKVEVIETLTPNFFTPYVTNTVELSPTSTTEIK